MNSEVTTVYKLLLYALVSMIQIFLPTVFLLISSLLSPDNIAQSCFDSVMSVMHLCFVSDIILLICACCRKYPSVCRCCGWNCQVYYFTVSIVNVAANVLTRIQLYNKSPTLEQSINQS